MDVFYRIHPRSYRSGFPTSINSGTLVDNGVCDEVNAPSLAHALAAYIKLLDDSPLLTLRGKKPLSVYARFMRHMITRPILESIVEYSSIRDAITMTASVTGVFGPCGEFDERMLTTPVAAEYIHWYKTGDSACLQYVLTFLSFLKKMDYEDSALKSTAFRGWLEYEQKLSEQHLDPVVTQSLYEIVSHILPPPRRLASDLKFGTGHVAERGVKGRNQKLNLINFDFSLQLFIDMLESPNSSMSVSDMLSFITRRYEAVDNSRRSVASYAKPSSRLSFVSKDVKKARSICMEPSDYMLCQQAILKWFSRSFDTAPIGSFIDLKDQTLNQKGALRGSIYKDLDTIDLSSASDSVSYELVKRVFPLPWLLPLSLTRTSSVILPDGTSFKVKKFAPMGSAVCFPVQCTIFTSIVLLAHWKFLSGEFEHPNMEVLLTNRVLHPPRVYGDDIICDSRVTDIVMDLLESLSFTVNRSKSFTGTQSFRESCGEYYWEGERVTPLTYSIPLSRSGNLTVSAYASCMKAANRSLSEGYYGLRSQYISRLQTKLDQPLKYRGRLVTTLTQFLPWGDDPDKDLVTLRSRPDNDTRYRTKNSETQRLIAKVITIDAAQPPVHVKDMVEEYELYRWLARSERVNEVQLPHRVLRPDEIRISLGWSPVI